MTSRSAHRKTQNKIVPNKRKRKLQNLELRLCYNAMDFFEDYSLSNRYCASLLFSTVHPTFIQSHIVTIKVDVSK